MKKITVIFLLGVLMTTSCKKFLDQDPNSQATDQTTWKSEGDANASVAACYSLIRSAFNASITYYTYGDLVSDEFQAIMGGDGAYNDILQMNWGVSIPSANTYDPRLKIRLYTNFYTAIAQSNRCLYFIDKMPNDVFTGDDDAGRLATKHKYMGEAYFTRAFNYFYMSRVWGDVPLTTEYLADVSTAPQLARSPQSQVLSQAIADCNMAKSYLNWQDGSSQDRVVRADKGAVFALMAHIYAWQGKYDSCAMACDSVINSGSYTLSDAAGYMNIFKGQSAESIFEISANSSAESQNATDVYSWTGVTLTPPYINNGAVQPYWQISTGLVNYLYSDTNDIRRSKAFIDLSVSGADIIECVKWANIQNVNNSSTYQIALNNTIVFRLADIELLKAEALAARTNPDPGGALSLVNDVRAHRGITDQLSGLTGSDLYYAIFDERGRELFMEGHRYFDLIRLERLTGDQQMLYMSQPDFLLGKNYWPVDPILFLTNSKLTQTPYWAGKVK